MIYTIDTEFIEDGKTIELISIGIVSEDGREFYAISTEFNPRKADDWVKENVLRQLPPKHPNPYRDSPRLCEESRFWMRKCDIKMGVLDFINPDSPEFWSYYGDYDWVVFCQLFGKMIDLPRGYPMYCRDLKQEIDRRGLSISQDDSAHNALEDARWIMKTLKALN